MQQKIDSADPSTTMSRERTQQALPASPFSGKHDPKHALSHAVNDNDAIEYEPTALQAGDTGPLLPTSLRPSPPLSRKRKHSEAAPSPSPSPERKAAKKKRPVSPPWRFRSVDGPTAIVRNGKRLSTRINKDSPAVSASEAETDGKPDIDAVLAEGGGRQRSKSRAASPPWTFDGVTGPSTITVDGKRKSGRVSRDVREAEQATRVSPRGHRKKDVEMAAVRPTSAPSASVGVGQPMALTKHAIGQSRDTVRGNTSQLSHQRKASDSSTTQLSGPPEALRRAIVCPPTTANPPSSSLRQTPQHSITSIIDKPSPKIKLRLKTRPRAPLPFPHPLAIPASPPHPPKLTLAQLIEHHELIAKQVPWLHANDTPPGLEHFARVAAQNAKREGEIRLRLIAAGQPGGALSREVAEIYRPDRQPEPLKQYGHHDQLVAHALYFRTLQEKERRLHLGNAKRLADACAVVVKTRRGPTEDDVRAQEEAEAKIVMAQVAFDVREKWRLVAEYVERTRVERWRHEDDMRREEQLRTRLARNERLFLRQRGEILSDDEDSAGDVGDVESDEGESEDSEIMSESGNEDSEDDAQGGDMTEEQLTEYLAARKTEEVGAAVLGDAAQVDDEDEEVDEEPPIKRRRTETGLAGTLAQLPTARIADTFVAAESANHNAEARVAFKQEINPADVMMDDVPEALLYETDDESDNMSDEDMSSSDAENIASGADDAESTRPTEDEAEEWDGEEEAEPDRSWVYGLLSKKERLAMRDALPTPPTTGGEDEEENDKDYQSLRVEGELVVDAVRPAPDLNITHIRDTSIEEGSPLAVTAPRTPAAEAGLTEDSDKEYVKESSLTPIPALLRGTLRSYQHAGLHWLASLYVSKTNGILADEMGLGKTIQTIAMLAHLAEEYGVWAPHLIIVPTSVILNWVTEFQKFLPGFRVLGYYGTLEERKEKRKGWVNDPHHEDRSKRGYNVIVTSYQLALKDLPALRNVKWHYLVLDEAHNIKNFLSQRFQSLIRLKTRARLLLTGTPLQNSLTELWSLLTFLTAGEDKLGPPGLRDFLRDWHEPVKEIFEAGKQTLSSEAQRVVKNLHTSLRPYLLRRLKSEVEKDLPSKTESVVVCKLSKRQRQLYNEFLGLSSTREKLSSGNAVSAGSVLLSLRRVCNHPDLFAERPIRTSYAMARTPVEPYAVRERVVRTLLGARDEVPQGLLLAPREHRGRRTATISRQLAAQHILQREVLELERRSVTTRQADLSTLAGCRLLQQHRERERRLQHLRSCIRSTAERADLVPLYGTDLRAKLSVKLGKRPFHLVSRDEKHYPASDQTEAFLNTCQLLETTKKSISERAEMLQPLIQRFAFVTPEVTAPVLDLLIPLRTQSLIRQDPGYLNAPDPFAEPRTRTAIAFPDKRLLLYDSGKLQRLALLLRELQSRGSRSLIFTQMTSVLNILESFLNLLGFSYLRLDGSTSVERRQLISEQFNSPDSRYQVMILSSRAGGIGLNLTGASSVIFYDLDWNPQMDRQCMDRAHRIGQVRDVHVYKLVSKLTVEENMLRRAGQKSMLDDVVVQQGHFTTDYDIPRVAGAESAAQDLAQQAVDRLFGGSAEAGKGLAQTIEAVEDGEDATAAQRAAREDAQDDFAFSDRASASRAATAVAASDGGGGVEEGHVDAYMVGWMESMVGELGWVAPAVGQGRRLDRHGRDPSHRKRKR